MVDQVLLPLNRGSNFVRTLTLTDDGVAVDITGWTFSIPETTPAALAASTTCTVLSGPAGTMTLSCAWSDSWPDGKGPKASFRIKPSALSDAFPEILVDLQ